jgi:hypothetical protein
LAKRPFRRITVQADLVVGVALLPVACSSAVQSEAVPPDRDAPLYLIRTLPLYLIRTLPLYLIRTLPLYLIRTLLPDQLQLIREGRALQPMRWDMPDPQLIGAEAVREWGGAEAVREMGWLWCAYAELMSGLVLLYVYRSRPLPDPRRLQGHPTVVSSPG